jgi:hypothetical protein
MQTLKGIWTFDLSLTAILKEWFTRTVNAKRQSIYESDHDTTSQARLVVNTVERLKVRQAKEPATDSDGIVPQESESLIQDRITTYH